MLVVECGPEHWVERSYVVDVLLGCFLGLDYRLAEGSADDVVIRLGDDDGRRLVIRDRLFRTAATLLDTTALPEGELERVPAESFAGARIFGDLPVLYGDTVVRLTDGGVELGVDVFGGAFVMLTRLEEALPGARDAHDRFPAAASLASRHGFLDRPIVNEYAEVVWWALARLWPGLRTSPPFVPGAPDPRCRLAVLLARQVGRVAGQGRARRRCAA